MSDAALLNAELIIVINLDRYPERLKAFGERNSHLGLIRRLGAIDGTKVNRTDLIADGGMVPGLDISDGALGCALSHVSLWKEAIRTGRALTIVEDDAVLAPDFVRRAAEILHDAPEGWDLVVWGWNQDATMVAELARGIDSYIIQAPGRDMGKVVQGVVEGGGAAERLFRLRRFCGALCYTISPAGAARLAGFLSPLRPLALPLPERGGLTLAYGIDMMMSVLLPDMSAFVCLPPLAASPNDPSTSSTGSQPHAPARHREPARRAIPVDAFVESQLLDNARRMLTLDRADLAESIISLALAQNPRFADGHTLMAAACEHKGAWDAQVDHLRKAVDAEPTVQTRLNLALALLRLGRHDEGFALYEARLEKDSWSSRALARSRQALDTKRLRRGDSVAGRRIVVVCEQGLGDCVMFARYIPKLAALGAQITLVCSAVLRPVFAGVTGIERLLSPPDAHNLAQIDLQKLDFDAWVSLISLPHVLPRLGVPPAWDGPYLQADPTRVAHWRDVYDTAGTPPHKRVGLVFQAAPEGGAFAAKSMTIADLAPLLDIPGCEVVNLQYGKPGRELADTHPAVLDPLATPVPLNDFAAAVKATDLLVTVDTMAAHYAGAMGHEVLLVSPFAPAWMWGLETSCAWYPSVTIVRQIRPGRWASVMHNITSRISDLLHIRN